MLCKIFVVIELLAMSSWGCNFASVKAQRTQSELVMSISTFRYVPRERAWSGQVKSSQVKSSHFYLGRVALSALG